MSDKQEALKIIQALPDDCSTDDILAELYFKKQVDTGLKDIAEGRTLTGAGCTGGGIQIEQGEIVAGALEVIGNGGPGIETLTPGLNSLGVGNVKVLNNQGPGIDVTGDLRVYGPLQVRGNQGTGISVTGPPVSAKPFTTSAPLEVSDNCGWGIVVGGKAQATVEITQLTRVNNNGTGTGCTGGGIQIEQGEIATSGTLGVVGNGGPGIQTLTPGLNVLNNVNVRSNQGSGIDVAGSLVASNLFVMRNQGDGINAPDITINAGVVCNNTGAEIVGDPTPQLVNVIVCPF